MEVADGGVMRRAISDAQRRRIAAAGRWVCGMCTELLPAAFQIDHIVPLANGGADDTSNMWALCADCHADKTQQEAIMRAKKKTRTLPFLYCSRCERRLSPYFTRHACNGAP